MPGEGTIEKAGSSTTGAKLLGSFDGRLANFRVSGQSQVVVGADHDQLFVPNGDLGTLSIIEGHKERIEAGFHQLLGFGPVPALLKDVHIAPLAGKKAALVGSTRLVAAGGTTGACAGSTTATRPTYRVGGAIAAFANRRKE